MYGQAPSVWMAPAFVGIKSKWTIREVETWDGYV